MRCISLLKRTIVPALFVLPSLLAGCSSQPQPDHRLRGPTFYKIRFDSSMNILCVPAASLDTAKSLLKDVLEVAGRAVSVRPDTVVIALSYVVLEDRRYPGERRTIRRTSSPALPDLLLIPVQLAVHIEPWNPRGGNRLISTVVPIVFLLGALLSLRYGHW